MRTQRNKTKRNAFRLFSFAVALVLFVSVMSGCSILQRLEHGGASGNVTDQIEVATEDLDILDAALIAAAAQAVDNGLLLAECRVNADSKELCLSLEDTTLVFNLSQHSVVKEAGVSGFERVFVYTAGFLNLDASLAQVVEGYRQRLRAYANYSSIETDVDSDGEIEYVFSVRDMLSGMGDSVGYGNGESVFDTLFSLSAEICLYLDATDNGIVYQAAAVEGFGALETAHISNGLMKLTDTNGVNAYPLMVNADGIGNSVYSDQDFMSICNIYANGLLAQGHKDVRAKRANVVPMHEKEILLCYGGDDEYTFELLAWYQGRPVVAFSFSANDGGALFLTPAHDRYALFAYQQNFEDNYNQNYSYQTYMFEDGYCIEKTDAKDIAMDLNIGVDSETNEFFRLVMDRLEGAIVCYDPYKLTGYTVMPNDKDASAALPDNLYLFITNCSTSKSGYVVLEDAKSWLSLRQGPSTSYDRVVMDPSDKKSYVKQSLYTPVTILEPVNTTNSKYPIWVKLQVSYQNRTFTGYSSQKYIEIPGIKTMSIGEAFTVETDTNDTYLRWTSSDAKVAYVDPYSGRITAYKSGLVLITVTSAGGLTESCLIRIV